MFMILACVSAKYLQVIVVTDRSLTEPPREEGTTTEPSRSYAEHGTPATPAYPPYYERSANKENYYSTLTPYTEEYVNWSTYWHKIVWKMIQLFRQKCYSWNKRSRSIAISLKMYIVPIIIVGISQRTYIYSPQCVSCPIWSANEVIVGFILAKKNLGPTLALNLISLESLVSLRHLDFQVVTFYFS